MPRRAIPIQQTASGSWQLRYRDQFGNQNKETFPTYRQAETRHAEVTSKVRRGIFIDAAKGRQTFADFAAEWAASRDWKETSAQGWPDVYRRIDPYLGQLCLVAEIDRMTLEAMQQPAAEELCPLHRGTDHEPGQICDAGCLRQWAH